MIAPGTDGSLALYPEATFHKLAQRIEQTPPNARDVRAFSRMFYARSQPVDVDPQGRLRVPAELAELAGLDKRVVLLGVRDHLELWDHDRWEVYLSTQDSDYDALAENVFHYRSQEAGVGNQGSGLWNQGSEVRGQASGNGSQVDHKITDMSSDSALPDTDHRPPTPDPRLPTPEARLAAPDSRSPTYPR